jgi:hypothetical protein
MLSKEPEGKTKKMFSKCKYIHDYIWVCFKGLLKWWWTWEIDRKI